MENLYEKISSSNVSEIEGGKIKIEVNYKDWTSLNEIVDLKNI